MSEVFWTGNILATFHLPRNQCEWPQKFWDCRNIHVCQLHITPWTVQVFHRGNQFLFKVEGEEGKKKIPFLQDGQVPALSALPRHVQKLPAPLSPRPPRWWWIQSESGPLPRNPHHAIHQQSPRASQWPIRTANGVPFAPRHFSCLHYPGSLTPGVVQGQCLN